MITKSSIALIFFHEYNPMFKRTDLVVKYWTMTFLEIVDSYRDATNDIYLPIVYFEDLGIHNKFHNDDNVEMKHVLSVLEEEIKNFKELMDYSLPVVPSDSRIAIDWLTEAQVRSFQRFVKFLGGDE